LTKDRFYVNIKIEGDYIMGEFVNKIMVLSIFLVIGCSNNGEQEMAERPINSEWQVYNHNKTKYDESIDLIGTPYITSAVSDAANGWDSNIPTSTSLQEDVPWIIEGKIENGILTIDFPHEELELPENYGSDWTQGAKIAEMHIQDTNRMHIALHKHDNKNNDSRIYIYYVDKDFNKFNDGTVHLKKGWNFAEVTGYQNIGLVTQDINDFIKKGYRWQLELWD
jgi:hypothetical protein